MARFSLWTAAGAACLLLMASFCSADEGTAATKTQGAATKTAAGVIVLDTSGFWRMHHTFKPPVVIDGDAARAIVTCGVSGTAGAAYLKGLLGLETPPPPAEWAQTDFDDSAWVRSTGGGFCHTPYLARLCLRGTFAVTDPAKVQGLSLSVGYYGGVVVYLNGKEMARRDIEPDAALARAYPKECFVTESGDVISLRGSQVAAQKDKVTPELARRIDARSRTTEVTIPATGLRPGTNVLAIEVIRSPYDKVVDEKKVMQDNHGVFEVNELSWNTCELRRVQLRSPSSEGLIPAATRPPGIQVWNSDPMAVDYDLDFAGSAELLRPIRLVGPRNGVFSGKVVVGSDQPIRGLVATVSDLSGPSGTIPAAQVLVRYAIPWGTLPLTTVANYEQTPYPAKASPLVALTEVPLASFPVRGAVAGKADADGGDTGSAASQKRGPARAAFLSTPDQPEPVFGAVVPVWVTVTVPRDAKVGTYAGRLAIQADGKKVAEVPVEMKVVDWTLPNPGDRRTWTELIQVPDTTAIEYGLPLWSDRHWEMIAKSLQFCRDMGSKVVYVPLIAQTNLGAAESMVRWVKKGDGYEYDFSIMEKYLDTVEKNLGRPQIVVFNVWDRYLVREGNLRRSRNSLRTALDGPMVTLLKGDGTPEPLGLPDYSEPESKALWKPLFDELRKRMARRGLEDAMMLGMVSDFWASKEQALMLKDVSGGLPWIQASHYSQDSFQDGLIPIKYQAAFFGTRFGFRGCMNGWADPVLRADFERLPIDTMSIAKWRVISQQVITGNARGMGRVGADLWYCVKDKNGNRVGRAYARFPASDWGYLSCNSSTLAPGPMGPVATLRYEALREGVQECEAIIVLREALSDPARRSRLGDALAKRCETLVTELNDCSWRAVISWQSGAQPVLDATSWRGTPSPVGHTWFVGSGWQQRTEELYSLAGEVSAKLAG